MHEVGELWPKGNKTTAPCRVPLIRRYSALASGAFPDIRVLIDLVRQTAHQATTETRNLCRVEAQTLPFRHPHRHRVEPVHKGRTAQTAAARAESATHPCTISDSEWTHFDLSPIPPSELTQEGPEIESTLGGETDYCLAPGQRQPRFDGSHVEAEFPGSTTKVALDLAFDVAGVFAAFLILVRRQPNNPSGRSGTFAKDRQRKEADATEKLPVRGLDEITVVVANLEGAGAAGYGRQIGVDDHRNKILDPRRHLDLGE